jgi:hypothetical protein
MIHEKNSFDLHQQQLEIYVNIGFFLFIAELRKKRG